MPSGYQLIMAIVRILAIGTKMPHWILDGCGEYLMRFRKQFQVTIEEIPASKCNGKREFEEHRKSLFRRIKSTDILILLDPQGKQYTTEQLAEQLTVWELAGGNLVFAIGGANGWCKPVRNRAYSIWSLSNLVFPHTLARVILVEQLYRADSVRQGHPYHRS